MARVEATIPLSIEEIERKFGEAYVKYLGKRRESAHAVADLHDKHHKVELIRHKESFTNWKVNLAAYVNVALNVASVGAATLPFVKIPSDSYVAELLSGILTSDKGISSLSSNIAEAASNVLSAADKVSGAAKNFADMSTSGERVEISAHQEEYNRHLAKKEQEAQSLEQEINRALNDIEERRNQKSQLMARIAN